MSKDPFSLSLTYLRELKKLVEPKVKEFQYRCLKITQLSIIETYIRPVAVYVIGSFARDVGAFIYDEITGNIRPIRDLDLFLIVNRKFDAEPLIQICDKANIRLGFHPLSARTYPFEEFTVWVSQLNLSDLNMPLLKLYELKLCGKLLMGTDVRHLIRVQLDDISLYNAFLIIFSKFEALLAFLSLFRLLENKSTSLKQSVKENLVYECLKAYTEMGTILSIIGKVYDVSYIRRCENVFKSFIKIAPALATISPDLARRILISSHLRAVIPLSLLDKIDLNRLVSETVRDLVLFIAYFAMRTRAVKLRELSDFSKVTTRCGTTWLSDFFRKYMKLAFLRNAFSLFVPLLSTLYMYVAVYKAAILLRRKALSLHPAILLRPHKLYLTWYLCYLALLALLGRRDVVDVVSDLRKLFRISAFSNTKLDPAKLGLFIAKVARIIDAALHGKA